MRYLPKTLLMAVFATALMASDASAVMRKCSTTFNGLPVDMQRPHVMVDGNLLGNDAFAVDQYRLHADADDLAYVSIGCIEVERDGEIVGISVVAAVTRDGAVGVMRSYMKALGEAQQEYRTATGAYARDLNTLGFFVSRTPLPVDMTVTDGQWTASLQLDGHETSCQVGSTVAVSCRQRTSAAPS